MKRSMIRAGYDHCAKKYAEIFRSELDHKPFDREVLDRFKTVAGECVVDVGCGPGHIGRYVSPNAVGADLSTAMMRAGFPDMRYVTTDMTRLAFRDQSIDGIVAFYSIIHLPRGDAPRALSEFARVLRSGGRLLMSFHGGEGEEQVKEFLDEPVPMAATLFSMEEMTAYVRKAGFEIEEALTRPPYEQEYPTERMYIRAATTRSP